MLPLAGIKVVEIGQVFAGPYAGAILADLGAEVIKIEKPDGGDDARQMGKAFRRGDALNFVEFNRGKKSVALDLKSREGVDALHALLQHADILVHNMRPGVPEALGLGPAETTARHPQLVYCAMGAFGHRGPMKDRPGYEPLLQAYGGLSSITGAPDGPPVRMGSSVVDQGTGMWTVIGALAALRRREVTGRGGVVNTSLLETAVAWGNQKIAAWINQGQKPVRHASGHPDFVPYEAFDAADGPFLICCGNDRLFAKLAREVGHAEWIADPRFATNRARLGNKDALLAPLRAALLAKPRAHWLQALVAAGVPCAPINTIEELVEEPQVQAMGMLVTPPGEDYRVVATPISFDDARPIPRAGAPTLDQHRGAGFDED
ncbi:CaiB/BaiF CoA transferase family protein [Falsiroseomonas sp. HW251]|uniref:CaiB/BaiF CoA transferase family protein n=1 Tax=Falsiroseomonas sp. HW251 TaxID=3390998 RepID=UPI003D311B68